MASIEELKARVEELEQQLAGARKEYNDARIAEHPLKVGDIIENRKGNRGQVVGHGIGFGEPYALYKKFLKGGQLGATARQTYSWDRWEKVSP